MVGEHEYKIVNFDKLDYCASLANTIEEIADYPNYTFVKVRFEPTSPTIDSERQGQT